MKINKTTKKELTCSIITCIIAVFVFAVACVDTTGRYFLYFMLATTIAALVVFVIMVCKLAFGVGQDLRKTIENVSQKPNDNAEE